MNTTHNEKGEAVPYRRRFVLFAAGRPGADGTTAPGVHVEKVDSDPSPFPHRTSIRATPMRIRMETCLIQTIDLAIEQVNMMEASRAYDANVTMMDTTKAMIASAITLNFA